MNVEATRAVLKAVVMVNTGSPRDPGGAHTDERVREVMERADAYAKAEGDARELKSRSRRREMNDDFIIDCANCNGAGQLTALVTRASGCKEEGVVCSVCRGAGTLTWERYREVMRGESAYRQRVWRGESLREAAEKIGCLPVALADYEHGRGPAPEGA